MTTRSHDAPSNRDPHVLLGRIVDAATDLAHLVTTKRAACAVDSSGDSANPQGTQVANPAAALPSETPRTDALAGSQPETGDLWVLRDQYDDMFELARTIERELAARMPKPCCFEWETCKTPCVPRSEMWRKEAKEAEVTLAALRRELTALRAPVEDVESQVFDDGLGEPGNPQLVVPADYARDLHRRLTEAQERADKAYPYPEAEPWTVEELAAEYTKRCKEASEYHQWIGRLQASTESAEQLANELRARIAALEADLVLSRQANADGLTMIRALEAEKEQAVRDEREACAKTAENVRQVPYEANWVIAAAIRARGEGEKT